MSLCDKKCSCGADSHCIREENHVGGCHCGTTHRPTDRELYEEISEPLAGKGK